MLTPQSAGQPVLELQPILELKGIGKEFGAIRALLWLSLSTGLALILSVYCPVAECRTLIEPLAEADEGQAIQDGKRDGGRRKDGHDQARAE